MLHYKTLQNLVTDHSNLCIIFHELMVLSWVVFTWNLSYGCSLNRGWRWNPEAQLSRLSTKASSLACVDPSWVAGRARDLPDSSLFTWPSYVDFLPAWRSQGSQTPYMETGYLQMCDLRDLGRGCKAFCDLALEVQVLHLSHSTSQKIVKRQALLTFKGKGL